MDDSALKQNNKTDDIVVPTSQSGQEDKIVSGQNQYSPSASSFNKERMPSASSEKIKPSEEDVNLGDELKNVGVVANSDKPNLDDIHKQIGVTASLESTPIETNPSGEVVLPMTEEEADNTLKTNQSKFNLNENVGAQAGEYTEDSLPFFASLIKKVFKEMHRRVFRVKK